MHLPCCRTGASLGRIAGSMVVVLTSAAPLSARQVESELARALRARIEALRADGFASAAGEELRARVALPRFYENRAFQPAWLDTPSSRALLDSLVMAIRRARAHGLDPADYHLARIDSLARTSVDPSAPLRARVDLEMLASDAFMVLGSHLLQGRVNPETIDPEWLANRRDAAMDSVLDRALAQGSVGASLAALAPQDPRYRRMLGAAQRMHELAEQGGWPAVPDGPNLELGVDDGRVPALRTRLRASGDYPGPESDETVFDDDLRDAVRGFQRRHGMADDGVVGPATRAALNVPAEERARQLEINMERWRWLPADLGARHIEVNIAGFEAIVVEQGRVVQRHRVVVGQQYRQTPIFSATMTYLVLSPYWYVPPTIAALDKLPLIKRDPTYLKAQRMVLFDQSTNEPVDAEVIQWADVTGPEFNRRYRIRQEPGPTNALGAVKFMFPNKYDVYLHDTPARELFDQATRSFSSGCIRLQNPLELAEYLLADQPGWTRDHIEAVIAAGVERTIRLTRGVPIHLLYWTAWADEDGGIQFRDDIYGRDAAVWRGLSAPAPSQ